MVRLEYDLLYYLAFLIICGFLSFNFVCFDEPPSGVTVLDSQTCRLEDPVQTP